MRLFVYAGALLRLLALTQRVSFFLVSWCLYPIWASEEGNNHKNVPLLKMGTFIA